MDFYKTISLESRVCRPLLDGMIFFLKFFFPILEDDVCSYLERCFTEDVVEVVSNMNGDKASILLDSQWLFSNPVGVF